MHRCDCQRGPGHGGACGNGAAPPLPVAPPATTLGNAVERILPGEYPPRGVSGPLPVVAAAMPKEKP